MAIFNPQKIDTSLINGNQRYQNGDVVDAEAINAPIEASAWAQQVAQEAKLLAEAASGIGTEAFFEAIRNIVAPLHKLQIFTDETNPSEVYGGFWIKVKDAFLWCSGDKTSITYTVNGESYTQPLSVGSRGGNPTHTHLYRVLFQMRYGAVVGGDNDSIGVYDYPTNSYHRTNIMEGEDERSVNTSIVDSTKIVPTASRASEGATSTESTMPPYISVTAWYRVTEEEFNANESL